MLVSFINLITEIKAQFIILWTTGLFGPFWDPRTIWRWNQRYRLLNTRYSTSYTDYYLRRFANHDEMTTDAKLNILLEFAKCDLPGIYIAEKFHKLFRIKYGKTAFSQYITMYMNSNKKN